MNVRTIATEEFSTTFISDFDGRPLVTIKTDYSDTVVVFSQALDGWGSIEWTLPYVESSTMSWNPSQFSFEVIVCRVPPGENFFEADFSDFNETFLLGVGSQFIFQRETSPHPQEESSPTHPA